jgi:hypothetical protein
LILTGSLVMSVVAALEFYSEYGKRRKFRAVLTGAVFFGVLALCWVSGGAITHESF